MEKEYFEGIIFHQDDGFSIDNPAIKEVSMSTAYSVAVRSDDISERLWLNNKTWDLTFISLSAALVVLPFVAYEAFKYLLANEAFLSALGVDQADVLDVSRNIVNGMIALFIGGPHMYATYTRTFLDQDFRKHHAF